MGAAVWFVARSGAARRLVPGLVLAALVGLASGVVLTSWAGARRTDSAYERLSAAWHHADLAVTNEGGGPFDPSGIATAPGVAETEEIDGFALVSLTPEGGIDIASSTAVLGPVSPDAYYNLDRPLLVEGRLPDPEAPDEIMVPEAMRDAGYPIGSVHDVCAADFGEVVAYGHGILQGTASLDEQRIAVDDLCALHSLRVVGVTRLGPDEVVLREASEADTFPQTTPAFVAAAGAPKTFNVVLVDLEPGADVDRFVNAVVEGAGSSVTVQSAALKVAMVDRTIEPYVRALALFAAVAALAVFGVLGPAVVRWAGTPPVDRGPLLAVGLRPHELRLSSALRGAALGLVAAAVAAGVAIAASSRFPIGIAAQMEPDPGVRLDALVLATGVVGIVLLATVLGAVAPARDRAASRRSSRVAEALQGAGVGLAPLAGIRAALSGDGRGAGAARAAGGVAVAIVAVVTALTYQAGLGRLLDTPARYGWTWDGVIDTADDGISPELEAAVVDDPSVTAVSVGYRTSLLRGGAAVQTFAFRTVEGRAYPTILEGRAPLGADEIALGGQTLDRLGLAVGDEVSFRGSQGQELELTVVGQTLLPLMSLGQDLSVAEGGLVDVALIDALGGPDPEDQLDAGLVLVDLAPGATVDELAASLVERGLLLPDFPVVGPTHTADLRGYDAVRSTPLLLAGVLALLGVGVLAHTIAGAARRRRRELAILRCLGFISRDLRATVRWNALTVVGLCLAVALPLGVALGRTLWSRFADSIGLVDDGVTPVGAVAAVIVATVASALVLAVMPGRQAGHVSSAEILRSE